MARGLFIREARLTRTNIKHTPCRASHEGVSRRVASRAVLYKLVLCCAVRLTSLLLKLLPHPWRFSPPLSLKPADRPF